MTAGSRWTWAGVPSAMTLPKSSTTMRSARSITTPMSCSTSTIGSRFASRMSRTKRARSSFSSRFMPAIGSSISSIRGSSASARPRSTRLRSP